MIRLPYRLFLQKRRVQRVARGISMWVWRDSTVQAWNWSKPHRCPECHTIVDDGEPRSNWGRYECCRCGTQFARRPRLAKWTKVRRCQDIANGKCPHQRTD